MREPGRVVVVGGGLAAVRTCVGVRARGSTAELVVLSAEDEPPYDRPPLSKEVLVDPDHDPALPFDVEALGVDLRLGTRAAGLDPRRRVVATDRGDVSYDQLVVATGATPVRLPGKGEQLVVRTLADARALRARLVPGAAVVVVGASWVGAEVSTAALARGCRVTCVEAGRLPLERALGVEAAERLLPHWAEVDLRLSAPVRQVDPGAVVLQDGTRLAADVVVVGIGVRAEVGWLAGSGLALDAGVLVDEHLRTSAEGVLAVGDCARRWSPRYGRRVLLEHWDEAATAGGTAAGVLLGEPEVQDPVPYFWSAQFGRWLQVVGLRGDDDRLDWHDGLGVWTGPDGSVTAALAVDRGREARRLLRALQRGQRTGLERD